MPQKGGRKTKKHISQYFLRSEKGNKEKESIPSDESERKTNKMDATSNSNATTMDDLRELIMLMDKNITSNFRETNANIKSLSERLDAVDVDMKNIKEDQKSTNNEVTDLKNEVSNLKSELLRAQVHERKYNLLIYGLSGFENSTEECVGRIREFAKHDLKLNENFANTMQIKNAHRLQRRYEAPTPIIVVFANWSERETFLKAGINLRGKRISIRTDLPPQLKARRFELAKKAYTLRQEHSLQARVREKNIDIWIETRKDSSMPWRRLPPDN